MKKTTEVPQHHFSLKVDREPDGRWLAAAKSRKAESN